MINRATAFHSHLPQRTMSKAGEDDDVHRGSLLQRGTLSYKIEEVTDEELEKMDKWIGSTFKETFELNSFWMGQVLFICVYYFLGALFYTNVEEWPWLQTIYFITQTISTVGYGNISPTTVSGQLFTVFYLYAGALLVFSVVGSFTQHIFVDKIKRGFKKPLKRQKYQIVVRKTMICLMWIIVLFAIVLVGTVFFGVNESWTAQRAFYFSAVTASSVGYGDYALHDNHKLAVWFNIFYILFSVTLTSIALEKIINIRRHIMEAEMAQQMEAISITKQLLLAINPDGTEVSKSDYVLYMLMLSGKIDKNYDVKPWLDRFEEVDMDKDGVLTNKDVMLHEKLSSRMRSIHYSGRKGLSKPMSTLVLEEIRDVFAETLKLKAEHEEFSLATIQQNLNLGSLFQWESQQTQKTQGSPEESNMSDEHNVVVPSSNESFSGDLYTITSSVPFAYSNRSASSSGTSLDSNSNNIGEAKATIPMVPLKDSNAPGGTINPLQSATTGAATGIGQEGSDVDNEAV